MNPRHAAGLALMGWLLIVPPDVDEDGHPAKSAPLVKWEHMGSYKSVEECNADRKSFIKRDQEEYNLSLGSNPPAATLPKDATRQGALKSRAALCIATDDPRLTT